MMKLKIQKKYGLLIAFFLITFIVKADQSIFPYNSVWKYLDNGSDQGTAWRSTSYNDVSWVSGPGQLGYGDGDEATVVSYGSNAANKYITTYFRKTINIANVSAFTSFLMSVKRDDGVVVYVNGVEAWRDNINGNVSYTTLAAADAPDDGNANLTATIPSSYFVNGNNVIAVEIHQFTVSSSDISFDMSLTGIEAASAQVIFPYNSVWKYLDNGTDQGTAWRSTVYNDATWASGPGQLGYGDGDEATVVSYGPSAANKYITTYFRKTINIANVSNFTSFLMSVQRDDGVVVYVNGVEVWRDNINGNVTYTTLAAADAPDDGNANLTATIPTSYFVNGNNVIAVEIHQFTVNSSDISFDMSLEGSNSTVLPTPVITRGAYLNVATPNSIIVRYRTDINTDSKVLYGTSSTNLANNASVPGSRTEHIVQLTNLQPNTKYFYALSGSNYIIQYDSTENFFITPPLVGTVKPTRMWVLGDMGFNTVEQNQVRDAYYNYSANTYTDLWLWLGDNAYNSGTDAEYQTKVFTNHYEKIFKKTTVWPAAGNHDLYSANATTQTGPYYEMFSFPTNGEAGGVPSGTKAYYSYNYANIHFVVLESTTASFRTNGGAMKSWLQTDLAANNQKWTIIYFHHPPYSKGSHNSDTESEMIEMRQNFNPLIEQYKVDMVLCGHSHNYERTYLIKDHFGNSSTFSNVNKINGTNGSPLNPYIKSASNNFNGTVYAVAGTGGIIEGTSPGWPHNAMVSYTDSKYGSMVIDINGDTLDARFIDNTLPYPLTFDQFRIVKQCDQMVTLPAFSSVCSGSSPVTLSGGIPSGGTYSGNGVSNGVFNPATAGVGTHLITYTYVNGFCTNTATSTITVNAGGQTAVVSPSGTVSTCPGTTVSLNANTGTGFTYQWKLNGTNISGATQSTYIANAAGSYTVVVTSACGSATSTATSVSFSNATATVSPAGNINVCTAPVTLSANTGSGLSYQWNLNGNVIPGATNSTYLVTNAGNYTVVVTQTSGCSATSNTVTASGTSYVITASGSTTICAASTVALSAPTGLLYTYQWYRNGTAISGGTNATLNAGTDGTYYCKIFNVLGCTGNSTSLVVSVINNPTPTITANGPTAICSNSSVELITNAYSGVSYQWEKNSVAIPGATSQSYMATSAGTYRVSQTANNCSKKSPTISVTTTAAPTATITASGSTALCGSQTVTLNATVVSGATYQWQLNTINIQGATTSTYVAGTAGNYTCVVTKGCSATSNTITVTTGSVSSTISPAGIQSICAGSTLVLEANTGSGLGYQWKLNGINISGATQSSYTANAAGDYTVVVTAACGSATSAITTINITSPTASITPAGAASICQGAGFLLSANTGNGLTYQWKLNGNVITGASQPTYTATTAGNYTVDVTSLCGTSTSNTVNLSITIPTAIISPTGAVSSCPGSTVNLTANTGTGFSYQWKLNGNNISGATQSTYGVTTGGSYSVDVTSSCGSATSSTTVVTFGSTSAQITPSGTINLCAGSNTTLSANTGSGLSYQWKLNGNIISGASLATYNANVAGDYTVVVTSACGSATSAATTIAIVTNQASVTPAGTVNVCPNSSQILSANTGAGLTYQWLLNGSPISGATGSTYTASNGGSYSVVVTNTCSSVTSAATTIVFPSIDATLTPAVGTYTICSGDVLALSVPVNANVNYQWFRNNVAISGATSRTYSVSQAGTFYVRIQPIGCSSFVSSGNTVVNVITNPTPTISSSAGANVCTGQSTTFSTNSFAGVTYQWQRENVNISGATNQTYIATLGGQYKVVQTANGCVRNSPQYKITLVSCRLEGYAENESNEKDVFIAPNPFAQYTTITLSPSFNFSQTKIEIFDMLGKKINSIIPQQKDVRWNRNDLPPGLYLVKVTDNNETNIVKRVIIQ